MSETTGSPFDLLFAVLGNFGVPIPEETKAEITENCIICEYKKGETILDYREICRNVSFILNGVAVSQFKVGIDERISWFMLQHDVFISIISFFDQKPGAEKIYALEDTTCICLPKTVLDDITDRCLAFMEVRLKLTEHYYKELARQQYVSHLPPLEQCAWLKMMKPALFEVVSQARIAKFLGIAEETISRKLAELKKNEGLDFDQVFYQ